MFSCGGAKSFGTMKTLVALLVVCCLLQALHAAKILCLIGTANHNNPAWTQPFLETLASRGHDLTIVGTSPNPTNPKINHVALKTNYDVIKKHYKDDNGHYNSVWGLTQIMIWYEAMLGSCRSILDNNDMLEQHRLAELNKDYDLVIYDATYSIDCLVSLLPNAQHSPVMALSGGKLTTDLMKLMRAQDTVSAALIPHFISRLPLPLSYWGRIQNHFMYIVEHLIRRLVAFPILNGMLLDNYKLPRIQLMLVNTHSALDYVQNIPPNVVEVGGLHIRAETQPLPISIQEFVEQYSEGIIYINLPNIQLMYGLGIQAIETMISGFTQYGFVWNIKNMDKFQLSQGFPNVRTVEFDDDMQQAILAQSHVKALITHGDSFSLQEAVYHGVPVIVLPLIMDQINNAQRIDERYLGVKISPEKTFTTICFAQALNRLVREEIFFEKSQEAQLHFRTRQTKPVDRAVWLTEQLILEPKLYQHLSSQDAMETNYFVGHSLDILVWPMAFFIFVIGHIIYAVLVWFDDRHYRKKHEKLAKSKKSKARTESQENVEKESEEMIATEGKKED